MEQNSTEQVDCNSIELDADKVNSCQILMDINDINIGTLKSALQALVPQENLSDYDIWLQDFKKLDQSHKLADDCMTVDGLVQVNVEILFIKKQITILDVIQPSEEMTRFTELQHIDQHINTNGVACIENAVNNSEDNKLTEFPFPEKIKAPVVEDVANATVPKIVNRIRKKPVKYMRIDKNDSNHKISSPKPMEKNGPNNGNVQLWTFLLELLTDSQYVNIIQWVGNDGKFKMIDPNEISRLWGERKNKKDMCYEHLSRALRYYYEEEAKNPILTKDDCERYAYKFIISIKDVLGKDPQQLSDLLNGKERQPRPRRHPNFVFSE